MGCYELSRRIVGPGVKPWGHRGTKQSGVNLYSSLLTFNGSTSFGRSNANSAVTGNSDRTVEFFCRPTGSFLSSVRSVVFWGESSPRQECHCTIWEGSLKFQTNSNDFLSSYAPVGDKWFHSAFVWSNGLVKLYIDGAFFGEKYLSSLLTSPGKIYLGAQYNDDYPGALLRHFNGNIKDLRVWETARTEAEVARNYDQKLTGNEAGLVYYYPLDEGGGDVAHDLASQNDMSLFDCTWS